MSKDFTAKRHAAQFVLGIDVSRFIAIPRDRLYGILDGTRRNNCNVASLGREGAKLAQEVAVLGAARDAGEAVVFDCVAARDMSDQDWDR